MKMGCVLELGGFICSAIVGCLMKGRRGNRDMKRKISYFPVFAIISFDDGDDDMMIVVVDDDDNNNNEVNLFLCLIKHHA
jgi:hypothetical protein